MNVKTKAVTALVGIAGAMALVVPTGASAATPTLTTEQQDTLQYIVEEEKLARDVYTYLATTTSSRKFSNVAAAEQQHMTAVSRLLTTYGVANPTTSRPAGVYSDPELQALYNTLIAQGSASYSAAIEVGKAIETRDIVDLKDIIASGFPSDVTFTLNQLLKGSNNHLRAFSR